MLVIKSDECIDCGVCEPECPVDAIVPDTLLKEPDKTYWIEFNDKYAVDWPNIVRRKAAPDDADDWQNVPDKMKYFDETPAEKA
tara:strand:- start:263 stop:514 length:252 start_codon:yes stop_codon:yes gene_type:complete